MLSKQEAKTNHRAHSVVTLSSPRRLLLLRPLFLRRLPLHLLLRPALPERGRRQLPSDQRFLGRGILEVFCSLPNGTPRGTAAVESPNVNPAPGLASGRTSRRSQTSRTPKISKHKKAPRPTRIAGLFGVTEWC